MARGYGADDLYRMLKEIESGKKAAENKEDQGIDAVTKSLRELYESFMKAGFTDEQSTLFVNTVVRAMAETVIKELIEMAEKKKGQQSA